jgi:hypothetical protein
MKEEEGEEKGDQNTDERRDGTRDGTGRETERDKGRNGTRDGTGRGTGRTCGTDGRDGRAVRTGGTGGRDGRDGRAEGRWGGRKGGRMDGALVPLKAAPFHLFKAVSGLTQKMWVSEEGEVKSHPCFAFCPPFPTPLPLIWPYCRALVAVFALCFCGPFGASSFLVL